jgi:Rrf2 family protein
MAYSSALTQGAAILVFLHIIKNMGKQDAIPSRVLSEHIGIPLPTTTKALKGLSASGLIMAKEGFNGGNSLARPLSEYTLLDVFMAVEQDGTLFKMHTSIPCVHPFVADLQKRLSHCISEATEAMKASLASITLEQICNGSLDGLI